MKHKRRNLSLLPLRILPMAFGCSSSSSSQSASRVGWEVDKKYLDEDTAEKGRIETVTYQTEDYATGSGRTEEKSCNVYLPYGYNRETKYNILYLIHGTDKQSVNHIETWFYTIKAKTRLDNRIYEKTIDPLIVVTPTFYSYGLFGDDDRKDIKDVSEVKRKSNLNFPDELRKDIIPAIESRYSTYALSTDEDGFRNSRNHRAIAGLSNGARLTLQAGRIHSFDYFSCFGCYSSSVDSEEILSALRQDRFRNYSLDCRFNGDGIFDFAYNAHRKRVDRLLEDGKDIFNSSNTFYKKVNRGYHSPRSWRVSLFNSLLYFFK